MLMLIMLSPGTMGTEEPPGITAFNLRLPRVPPTISSSLENGVPSGISKFPGRSTWPETEKHLTPPLLGIPISANHFAPLRKIDGTDARVSVLLMVVGRP